MKRKFEPEIAEIEAFGHKFTLLPGLAKDLITLEGEGAIYSHFWDEEDQTFRYYRINFLPSEIYQYVEAHVAQQEYLNARLHGATFEEGLKSISNPIITQRVRSYGNYGKTKLKDGSVVDIRGCAASFYGPDLEKLVCGGSPDRYEILPKLQDMDKTSFLIQILDYFPTVSRFLAKRKHKRPSYQIENEYDVQDLLYTIVRSVFEDARMEEWTIKHAGKSKRIDIVIPSANVVIETKYVRSDDHANSISDELKIDIESYHVHPSCKILIIFVFDPMSFIIDPLELKNGLSGRRIKGDSSFEVNLLVRK